MQKVVEVPVIFDDVKFGIDVRDERQKRGLTQLDVARSIGYSDGVSISAIECARKTDAVSIRRYMSLCNLLGLHPMHYWTCDDPYPPTLAELEDWTNA